MAALGLLVAGCGSSGAGGSGGSSGAGGSAGSGGGSAAAATGPGATSAAGGSGSGTGARFRIGTTLPPGLANKPAPAIKLTDARGGTFDTASLTGTPYLVTFLYTNCPDVCPLIGDEIRQALDGLGADAQRVGVVAVSVDPRHDDAAAVQAWLKRHREPPQFHYLIGSEAQLAPVWKAWYAAPQIPGDPNSAHSAVVWLVDRRGRIATKVDAGAAFDPHALAGDVRTLLN
ncbi:MAG: alkyl hydroperoxide reductase/Thiol specific antioxidant/Mal allergen [Conexibacter sp.]|nr:alkyl hydroperoxide reductase/Thiol specific antioxidant/Mal allergen [Conexibacter sp.]